MGRYEKYLYLFIDILVLNLATFIAAYIRFSEFEKFGQVNYQYLLIIMNLLYIAVAQIKSNETETRRYLNVDIFKAQMKRITFFTLSLFAVIAIFKGHAFSRTFIFIELVLFLLMSVSMRIIVAAGIKEYRRQGFNHKRIVVIGINPTSQEFIDDINRNLHYGYRILGVFEEQVLNVKNDAEVDGGDIYSFIESKNVDEVYLSIESVNEDCEQLIHYCDIRAIEVKVLNRTIRELDQRRRQVRVDNTGAIPIVTLESRNSDLRFLLAIKRAFDVVFSFLLLTFLFSWLFPLIALLIKLDSKGPAFFVQERTGINNQTFKCLKFRTMYVNNATDSKQATRNDSRITRIGKILRATDLDELPQFLNVLKGDMSIVGPRPHMLAHTKHYKGRVRAYMQRHWIKPGITGLAQIKGYRGETANIEAMEGRVMWDRVYLRNSDFALDARIIARTAMNMIFWEKRGY